MTWFNRSYLHKKQITIDHTKVGGGADLSNFPVLISLTDNDLRTIGNGGFVQNGSGFDIIFTNSTETTQLFHEIETYNGTTGTLVFWVKVPTASQSVDTNIFVYFDNSGIASFQSTASSVWDSQYNNVYHLGNGSSLNANDSTANANNGTNNGATATAGQIDGGASFRVPYKTVILADTPLRYYRVDEASGTVATDLGSQGQNGTITGTVTYSATSLIAEDQNTAMTLDGASGYIDVPTTGLPSGAAPISLEFWFEVSSLPTNFQMPISLGTRSSGQEVNLYFQTNGALTMEIFGVNGIAGVIPSLNTPHHVVLTYDGTTYTYYFDTALLGTCTATANITYGAAHIGAQASPLNLFFPGTLDEVAVYGYALSSMQVANHYNAATNDVTGPYVSAPNTGLGGLAALTVEFWVSPNYSSNYDRILGCSHSQVDFKGFNVYLDPVYHGAVIIIGNGVAVVFSNVAAVNGLGLWSHCAFVYDGVNVTAYSNGVSAGSVPATGAIAAPANALTMGMLSSGGYGHMSGVLDEVRISTIARSSGWIATEYNSQSSPGTFLTFGAKQNVPAMRLMDGYGGVFS